MSGVRRVATRLLSGCLAAGLLLVTPGFGGVASARGPNKADVFATIGSVSGYVGQSFPVSYSVGNAGPADATGVTITIAIPDPLVLDTTMSSACALVDATATCPLGTIPAGLGVGGHLWFIAQAPATVQLTLQARGEQRDPDLSNNTAAGTITATVSADVSVTMSDASASAGQGFFFAVQAGNAGPSPATGVVVTVELPVGVVLTEPQQCSSSSASTCTLSLGSLPAPSGSVAILRLLAAAPGIYEMRAVVTATTPDPDPSDNADTAIITVL